MKLFWTLPALIAGSILVTAAGAEQSVDLEFAVVSQYLWRGADLGKVYDPAGGDNHVHFQPSVTYTDASGVSFGAWASMGFDGHSNFDEIDLTVGYSFSGKSGAEVSVGHIYYDFPTGRSNSGEFYAGVSLPKSAFVPSLFVYYDYDDGDGWYAELSMERQVSACVPGVPLSAGLTVGYNGGQWKSAGWKTGLSNVALTVKTTVSFRNEWSLSPALTYVITPGDRVNTENELVTSVSVAKSL